MTDSQPLWLRLRQIALVAEKLAPVEEELTSVLGIEVCFRDPGVGHFGLENALLPIGNQLLEVVAPVKANTAGGRYLERRKGDGGYMVITQCNDHAPRRARVEALGARTVPWRRDRWRSRICSVAVTTRSSPSTSAVRPSVSF